MRRLDVYFVGFTNFSGYKIFCSGHSRPSLSRKIDCDDRAKVNPHSHQTLKKKKMIKHFLTASWSHAHAIRIKIVCCCWFFKTSDLEWREDRQIYETVIIFPTSACAIMISARYKFYTNIRESNFLVPGNNAFKNKIVMMDLYQTFQSPIFVVFGSCVSWSQLQTILFPWERPRTNPLALTWFLINVKVQVRHFTSSFCTRGTKRRIYALTNFITEVRCCYCCCLAVTEQ